MIETTGIYNNTNRTRYVNQLMEHADFELKLNNQVELIGLALPDKFPIVEICIDSQVQYFGKNLPFNATPIEFAIGPILFNRSIEPVHITSIAKTENLNKNPYLSDYKSIFGLPVIHKDGYVVASLIFLSDSEIEFRNHEIRYATKAAEQLLITFEELIENDRINTLVTSIDEDTKRFFNLVEKSAYVIYELDAHGKYLYVNNAFERNIGYTKNELLEKYYWELVAPDYREKVISFYRNQVKNRSWSSYHEFPVINKNGEITWFGHSVQMIYENDKVVKIYASAVDINERRWIETNLISSNENLNALINSSENIVFVINEDLKFEKVFCKYEEYLHQPKRKFIGKHISEIWTDPNGIKMVEMARHTLAGNSALLHNYKFAPKEKEHYWEARFNTYRGFDEQKKLSVIISNISERKEYEEKLRISEEQYRLVSENSSDLVCMHTNKGYFQFISRSSFDLLGYSPEELEGKHPFAYIHEEDLQKIKEGSTSTEVVKKPLNNIEYRFRKKDGSYLWMEAYTKPVSDKDGNFIGFQSSSRNISKNKKDEEILAKYTEGLKFLNQLTSTSTLTTGQRIETALFTALEFFDLELGILSQIEGNDYTVLYNYSLHESLELNNGDKFDLQKTYCHLTYKSADIFYTHHMKDSPYANHPCYKEIHMEAYIGAAYYVNRKKAGTISFSSRQPRDAFNAYEVDFMKLLAIWIGFLLERDQWETTIQNEQRILESFVETAPAAIAMMNDKLEYIAISKRWKLDNNLDDTAIGQNIFDSTSWDFSKWRVTYEEVLCGQVKKKDEENIELGNGESKWIKWEVQPWYTIENEIGGIITFIEDITELKKQQMELISAKEAAEKATKVKEQFYSTISHEIRTPLNAVIGMANLLLLEEHLPRQYKKLELLKSSGQNLMMLINDVLDFNKIESDKIDLAYNSFDLHKLVSDIIEIFKPKADEKGIDLSFEYNGDLPRAFVCDSLRLGQVLNNLVSNAIKFTDKGNVKVVVKGKQTLDRYKLDFEVRDTGIGIPENKLNSIFEDFSQASNDITKKYGGTGLGLTISNKLIQLMGSEITVKSIEGLGSSFKFDLNLETGDENVVVAKNMADSFHTFKEDQRILIAEDNMGNQAVIESFMELWELNFDFAQNGQEAVDMIKSKKYDLILMDLRMPVMDGYDAAKKIRSMDDNYFKTVPILALTASALNNVKESILEAGMDDCVIKPFNPNELNAALCRYIENNGTLSNEETGEKLSEVFPYLASLVNGNNAAIKKIVQATSSSVLEAISKAQQAILEDDSELLRLQLHTLKPNLHSLGIDSILDKLPQNIIKNPEISSDVFDEIKLKTESISDKYGKN